jgi:hypothetical protein
MRRPRPLQPNSEQPHAVVGACGGQQQGAVLRHQCQLLRVGVAAEGGPPLQPRHLAAVACGVWHRQRPLPHPRTRADARAAICWTGCKSGGWGFVCVCVCVCGGGGVEARRKNGVQSYPTQPAPNDDEQGLLGRAHRVASHDAPAPQGTMKGGGGVVLLSRHIQYATAPAGGGASSGWPHQTSTAPDSRPTATCTPASGDTGPGARGGSGARAVTAELKVATVPNCVERCTHTQQPGRERANNTTTVPTRLPLQRGHE